MGIFSPLDDTAPVVLTIPGLGNSGPGHWQTLWERSRPNTSRVDLGMWDTPHRNSWVTKLDQAIRTARAPVVLVAHSLGCLAVAWWAELSGQPYGWPVAGALLVAPPDVDGPVAPAEIRGFAPAPRRPLPFASVVVASSDDPWIEPDRARELAIGWGSHFVDAGPIGHINAESGLGAWDAGQDLLDRVLDVADCHGGSRRSLSEARAMLTAPAAQPVARLHQLA